MSYGVHMDAGTAFLIKRALQFKWGETPCTHPQLAQVTDLALAAGTWFCLSCGRDVIPNAAPSSAPLEAQASPALWTVRCQARTLGQLTPHMIRTAVPEGVFAISYQYVARRRVRIIYAGVKKVVAEVDGADTRYQQSIHLAEGKLTAACSCRLDERPFCRHCIAAFLAYHRLLPGSHEDLDPAWPAFPGTAKDSSPQGGIALAALPQSVKTR